MKSIVVLSVLFFAQAKAKIGFGLCPEPKGITFDEYTALYPYGSPNYKRKYVWTEKNDHVLKEILITYLFPNNDHPKCGERTSD